MAKVGRNDPCPCGSGKKYKNCCMRQDRVRASRELGLNDADVFLLNSLYQYAQRPRFAGSLSEAFALFWGGVYDLRGVSEIDADDARRTIEWFAHDYRADDGAYLIDSFIRSEVDALAPAIRERAEAWSRSMTGLFRVLHCADERLELYDCLRHKRLAVDEAVLSRNVQVGDVLIGRLYQLNGSKHLSPLTMILPEAYEPALVSYVTSAYERYVADHYQAGWDQFLRESGYIFNAYLLSTQGQALRPLIGPGTRFHDPAIARDRLRELTAHTRAERLRQEREATERRPSQHRTAAGIILPGAAPEAEPEPKPSSRPTILIPGRDL